MFSIEQHAGTTVIHGNCDIDGATSSELDALLRSAENEKKRVVISMAARNSCRAAGLSVIASAHRRTAGMLVLVAPEGSRFAETLAVTGLARLLRTAPTLQAALRAASMPLAPA